MKLRSILAVSTLSLAALIFATPILPAAADLGFCNPSPRPTISISDDFFEFEGGVAQLNVTLSNKFCSNVTVKYATADGTATTADYVAEADTLVFTPGQTSQVVTIAIKCDSFFEGVEDFTVKLSSPVNGTISKASGQVRIYNQYCTHQG